MSDYWGSSKLPNVLTVLLILLITDTVIGGPVGVFFRGERHVILTLIFLVGLYLGVRKWKNANCKFPPWSSHYLWPLYFFLSSQIWVFGVPIMSGGSCRLAIEDAQSLVMLPIAALILYVMQGAEIIQILLKIVVWGTLVLALCQVGLWLWLEFFPTNPASYYGYIEAFFNTKDSIFIFWQPSPMGGYVRVFWVSSLWLAIAVFAAPIVTKKKWLFFIEFVLAWAICVSYTRGMWLGVGVALLICTVVNYGSAFMKCRVPQIINWWGVLLSILCAVAIFTAVNYFAHGAHGLLSRLYVETEPSIAERMIQAELLLDKWKERPWMGFGYGAYLQKHHSVDSRPYLYEMMPFALLMKLGVIGFGLHLAALSGLFVSIIKRARTSNSGLMLGGGAAAFLLAAHTNPVLYSFVGMTAILLVLIWWSDLISSVIEADSEGTVK